ncbi:hypothetical protein AB0M80_08195 [Amycolatopsis sp. NPDC051045]|uniref:hypothetical protein n=1 Tax=Amycolatopsis sp. NPDC051045 TaxID=3156922 RepID=UPI00343150D0
MEAQKSESKEDRKTDVDVPTPELAPKVDAKRRLRAIAITGVGSLADIVGIAQLITSTVSLGALVAGLISVAIACAGLLWLWGKGVGWSVIGMVSLLVIGSATTGGALAGYWNRSTNDKGSTAGGISQAPVATSTETSQSRGASNSSNAIPSSNTPGVGGSNMDIPSRGQSVGEGKLAFRDGDYADFETGVIGNSVPNADLQFTFFTGAKNSYFATSTPGGHHMAPAPQSPDFEKCANILKTLHDHTEKTAVGGVGAWYCVETGDFNVAAIQVQKLPVDVRGITEISYKLWKG